MSLCNYYYANAWRKTYSFFSYSSWTKRRSFLYFLFISNKFCSNLEHRNLKLDNGYELIFKDYLSYKKQIENEKENENNNERIIYPDNKISSNKFIQSVTTINEKLPLSMLLCLLADGRQLTLDEIDRILVYLLEKKIKNSDQSSILSFFPYVFVF